MPWRAQPGATDEVPPPRCSASRLAQLACPPSRGEAPAGVPRRRAGCREAHRRRPEHAGRAARRRRPSSPSRTILRHGVARRRGSSPSRRTQSRRGGAASGGACPAARSSETAKRGRSTALTSAPRDGQMGPAALPAACPSCFRAAFYYAEVQVHRRDARPRSRGTRRRLGCGGDARRWQHIISGAPSRCGASPPRLVNTAWSLRPMALAVMPDGQRILSGSQTVRRPSTAPTRTPSSCTPTRVSALPDNQHALSAATAPPASRRQRRRRPAHLHAPRCRGALWRCCRRPPLPVARGLNPHRRDLVAPAPVPLSHCR